MKWVPEVCMIINIIIVKTRALNRQHPSIPLTSFKGKIHFGGQHKYILEGNTNTFTQARKYIHLTANNFFAHPQIYNSIALPPPLNDWQFSSSQDRYLNWVNHFLWTENKWYDMRMFNCLLENEISSPPKNSYFFSGSGLIVRPLWIHLLKSNHFCTRSNEFLPL